MKIYTDVTNLLNTNYLTGIQRVVREVLIRLIREQKHQLILLYYNEYYNHYLEVDCENFYARFCEGTGDLEDVFTSHVIHIEDITPGSVFFDLDGTWSLSTKRSVLLPRLKENGVKLAVYFYDMIPITHPQFCHSNTVNNFISYVGAYLQYADLIMASTESTLEVVRELEDRLGLPHIPSYSTWLGADFIVPAGEQEEVRPEAEQAASSGKYALMVGTLEPRKNHKYAIQAFEQGLFEQGMNLIFAGRVGWNMEDFMENLVKHPYYNKQLFHLKDMNDASIDYLYQHAHCVIFPTYNEGFGLPMIEAFERGIPVLASDIPVLREVGGDTASYFDLEHPESLVDKLNTWLIKPSEYEKQVEKVQQYSAVTWDKVAEDISVILEHIETGFPYAVPEHIRQMVYLTARSKDLLNTLPFVENYMPFIEEVILLCPDSMVQEMQAAYHGRLTLRYLTDTENLAGRKLPEDHAMRNFYLRCLAMQSDLLDDVFIMSDDDYRPLFPITEDVFLHEGRYRGYYCYHYRRWLGSQGNPTSFDISMYRTRDFLAEHGYSMLMYDSHQPQVIDRRVFCEMLSEHPEISEQGLSDWSIYFNYLNTRYNIQLEILPYITLSWPGNPHDWNVDVRPEKYVFENYYSELYEAGMIYQGLSPYYYEGVQYENMEKTVRYLRAMSEYDQARAMFYAYQADYDMLHGEYPYFAVDFHNGTAKITLPDPVAICENEITRVNMAVRTDQKGEGFRISYQFIDVVGKVIYESDPMDLNTDLEVIQLPVLGLYGRVKLMLRVIVQYREQEYAASAKLCIMENRTDHIRV